MEIRERVEDRSAVGSRGQGSDDLLWRHLKTVPAFRALLRAVEARFYQHVALPEPVLDVGCGDGHFAQMAFAEPLAAGIDPWWGPLQKARRTEMYNLLAQSLGDRLPFPDNCFASAFSNSVLEHIPDVQPVLCEISRVLQPGGRLVLTMPSHTFTEYLGGAGALQRVGLNGLADSYRRFVNFISRHAHTDPPEVWAERLAQAGFTVERWQTYFSKEALRALEWGHVQGVPSAVLHALTGHWILAPWESNLRRTERWLRPFYEEEAPERGAYILFVARKKASGPIEASLPPKLEIGDGGFKIGDSGLEIGDGKTEVETEGEVATIETTAEREEELESETAVTGLDEEVSEAANRRSDIVQWNIVQSPIPDVPSTDSISANPQSPISNVVTTGLVLLSLFLAVVAQSILSGNPSETAAGVRWYIYSIIPLLILVWRQRTATRPAGRPWRFPRLSEIPGRRWFYLLSLLLAFIAHRLVAGFIGQRPALALLLWFAAIAVAFYALTNPSAETDTHRASPITFHVSRFTLLAASLLFLAAFIVRLVSLGSHPFILNGIEASLGLEALNILNGQIRSPFATGWLTNPTLPLYLLALPLQLFGRSVVALRLLSALVGAITVVATFLIGQRLWGRAVGLVAAILLAGSHFHLHYSRLGLTNIWDPLLVLLALGLIGRAWPREAASNNGRVWLLAGLAIGFNAYLFTASRLLPLMLATLFFLVLLFDRDNLRRQWRHVLAATALALIVALPQLLYYNNNPGIFMDRANTLGILDSQSSWLAQEAARTGSSRDQLFWQQFSRAALAFNSSRDNSPVYRPPTPLLSFGPAVFFALGLVIAVLRLRHLRYALLVVWVVTTVVFAGALLVEPPNSHRLVIATPALSLLAAVALVEFGRLFLAGEQGSRGAEAQEREFTPAPEQSQVAHPLTRSQLLLLALVAIATLFALNDVAFYFGRYQAEHTFADRNTEIADNVADYLHQLGAGWTGYFYGPPTMYADFPTIPFLAGATFQPGTNLVDVAEGDVAPAPATSGNLVFIFLPERLDEVAPIEVMYPDGRLLTFDGYHANPLFHVYEVRR